MSKWTLPAYQQILTEIYLEDAFAFQRDRFEHLNESRFVPDDQVVSNKETMVTILFPGKTNTSML